MPEVTDLTIVNSSVQGSILAPKATLTSTGSAQVNGTAVVQRFAPTACVEMHPITSRGACASPSEGDKVS
jgi:choice-of-anchor A domain-containing protein